MPDTSPPPLGARGLSSDALLGRSFATVRKGFDPAAVRQALEDAARALREAQAREDELTRRLAEAERRAASPEIDEQTLTAALGAETAKVLQAAREAARELVESAERRAASTEREATELLDRSLRDAEQQRVTIVERSENEARALLSRAEQESRAMIDEARLARRKILSDLAERRRALHLQLEQLRAGKDALISVIDQAAGAVESIRSRLEGAEGFAQLAADQAGRLGAVRLDDQPIEAAVREALSSLEEITNVPVLGSGEELPGTSELGTRLERVGEAENAPAPARGDGASGLGDGLGEETGDHLEAEVAPSPPSVEELFARIRASREEETQRARAVLGDRTEPNVEDDAPVDEARTAVDEPGDAIEQDKAEEETKGLARTTPPEGDGDTPQEQAQAEVLLARRDELLAPSIEEVARSLKRVLRVEQNDVLDAVRTVKRIEDLAGLLPGEQAAKRLSQSAANGLRQAFEAGWRFAYELGAASSDPPEPTGADELVAAVADSLGDELVLLLAARIEGDEPTEDAEAFAGRIGSAFRELRGARLERFCAGFAVRSFAEAELQAASALSREVSWLVDDGDARCAECDDNQISGPQAPGEDFPTGHRVPPVHEGCRCLLVLSDT